MNKIKIGGVLSNDHLARISVMGIPDRPGTAAALLKALGEARINVQFIAQCIDLHDNDHIVLCVDRDDLDRTLTAVCEVEAALCAAGVSHDPHAASIGIVGPDFRERPGIAGLFFASLAEAGINIQAISTSISTVTAIIATHCMPDAITAIERVFDLP